MAGSESERTHDRLPDGSMQRRAEREAAAALAAELLLAAATKAAESLAAAKLAYDQRVAARDVAATLIP